MPSLCCSRAPRRHCTQHDSGTTVRSPRQGKDESHASASDGDHHQQAPSLLVLSPRAPWLSSSLVLPHSHREDAGTSCVCTRGVQARDACFVPSSVAFAIKARLTLGAFCSSRARRNTQPCRARECVSQSASSLCFCCVPHRLSCPCRQKPPVHSDTFLALLLTHPCVIASAAASMIVSATAETLCTHSDVRTE